ncbi:large ribosomal subunit protein bL28m isoform X2 [Archocentrus centrarchus]|uniref:large ribosomal subunit protein bL28m isoform X2 n=1 Tax=Archocentrus centrarchus TaxID=63155 RepID=UPI0011E9CC72|nr:39S ribosomal protein L28, mitochondrial isoform X2 [Archocentrus centrarchus]
MPLLKYSPKVWEALKLKQGIYARLPKHYLKSLEQKEPTPVHWRPLGVQYRANPNTGLKERVQDVPVPVYYPPESQDGLWGGEGWISGYRYANNDKMSTRLRKTWKAQVFKRELYPNDPIKREQVYEKYKQFEIPEEEAEWVGLSLEEAVEKQRQLEHKEPDPLFKVYVDKLAEDLHIKKLLEPHLIENK